MSVAHHADPSLGIRNVEPNARDATWSEGEAVRLVKSAWRNGYHGLACLIAVAWDTQFSPVDVRTLKERHRVIDDNGQLFFDRSTDGRTKTGRAALGTLSSRSERLVTDYLTQKGVDRLPDAVFVQDQNRQSLHGCPTEP